MRTALLMTVLALLAATLGAQANERIRFQGRLTTPAGAAITTATDVVFRMYAAPTGGTAQWTETHSGGSAITPSATGVFTVELGGITAITGVDFSQPVYVGITVGTDAEMTPRYLLTSAAHAHQAKNAATLGGLARTGFAELTGATFTGAVTATTFTGNGSGLTNVNSATLGGLARTGFAELTGATFTGAVTATQFNGSGAGLTSIPAGQLTGALPALNGSALTTLNASNLASGTVPSARLSGTYSEALTFNNLTSITTMSALVATLNVNGTQTTTGVQQFADASGDRFRVPRLASDPATGISNGMVYYNTATNRMRVYRNGSWADLGPASGTIVYSESSNDTALINAGYTRWQPGDTTSGFATSTTGAASGREYHTAVWTGTAMLVWGGRNGGTYFNTGGIYSPGTDSWSSISTTGAPSARAFHTAVWNGSVMLVWGGWNGSSYTNTGGSYSPSTNTWTAISTTGAPTARRSHTGLWVGVGSGSRMVIWGGSDGNALNTGGLYDAATNSWAAITTSGAPVARTNHVGVVVDSTRFIVWGGETTGGAEVNTGGVYSISTGVWTAVTTVGAPTARIVACGAVVSGRFLVWGGLGGGIAQPVGGVLNLSTGVWSPMSTNGQPPPRYSAVAQAMSSTMFVWGGVGALAHTGGIYDPASDSWITTGTENAPTTRYGHTIVRTGDETAILWGGNSPGIGATNTGGTYDGVYSRWRGRPLYAYQAP
ncbi:MAG: hypothetical protein KF754_14865 [Planctomycetes bacterium]|nr:hypothetical protein [Planctomycetota bacterium]